MYPTSVPYQAGNWTVVYDARINQFVPSGGEGSLASFSRRLEIDQSVKLVKAALDNQVDFVKRQNKNIAVTLLGISLVSLLMFLSPIVTAEVSYRTQAITQKFEKHKNVVSGFGEIIWLDEKGMPTPSDWGFSIIVPSVGINSKVLPKVNPVNENIYADALKSGAAHAENTALPNEPGMTYIFAHSTNALWNVSRYNAVFYPLQYTKTGDEIVIVYQGETFPYKITEKKIVDGDALEYLLNQTQDKLLVLQTCWPPGTTAKRLVVVAEPVGEKLSQLR